MLTQNELKSLLHYDPESGDLTWLKNNHNQRKAGEIAGWICSEGYRCIQIQHKAYKAHRLIYLYMMGHFPKEIMDHRNGNRADNHWSNLRSCSRDENAQNRKKQINKSGFTGVTWNKKLKKYAAAIRINTKLIHLGYFEDPAEGHQAYLLGKQKYHKFQPFIRRPE